MALRDYSVPHVEIPSFLQDVFKFNKKIALIHDKSEVDEYQMYESNNQKENIDSNYIANHLNVDLSDSNDVIIKDGEKMLNVWSQAERKYIPLEISLAHKLLNDLIEQEDGLLFVICDAKNANKTLFIGIENDGKVFCPTNYIVKYLGSHSKHSSVLNLDQMIQLHAKNTFAKEIFKIHISSLYSIKGGRKHIEQSVSNADHNAAIVEVLWEDKTYNIFEANVKDITLMLQVNCNNKFSFFQPFWESLQKVKNYLFNLKNHFNKIDELVINEDSFSCNDLCAEMAQSICDIPNTAEKRSIDWSCFKAQSFRNEDFMEKLFCTLNKCHDVNDLKHCFNDLFLELVHNDSTKPQISANSGIMISELLQGLIDGKLGLPVITSAAALKYFIELSLYKLCNDYIYMIEDLSPKSKAIFEADWHDTINKKLTVTNKSLGSIKMRFTAMMKSEHTTQDLPFLEKLANHLMRLHFTIELIYLAKTCAFTPNTFQKVCQDVCKRTDFPTSMKNVSLIEHKCKLPQDENSYFNKLKLISRNVRLAHDGSSSATIFHFSVLPLLPSDLYGHLVSDVGAMENEMFNVVEASIIND